MEKTYEPTLLSKLGFADSDRQDPMHDSICHYLTTASGCESFAAKCSPERFRMGSAGRRTQEFQVIECRAQRERVLASGTGRSRSAIGFLDLVIHATYDRRFQTTDWSGEARWERQEFNQAFVVEVKVNRESVGQIIRQVKLYRDFVNANLDGDLDDLAGYQFVVATRYEPTEAELAALEHQNIIHLFIGKGFDQYIEEQAAKKTVPTVLREV